ncbi:MAG: acyl carrier protein [Bacteroidales bacterium]|nr:acyl carrier protein [Bacteroidales bacterium]
MELNDFLAHFRELFDDTEPEAIEAGTEYKDLDEWSSLIAFSVIAMVKVEYGKTLTGAEIRHCNTVEDLFNTVASK